MVRVHAASSVLLFALVAGSAIQPGWSQASTNPPPTTAASVLSSASSAFSKGVPIHSVTLTGTVTSTIGSDIESGNVTLTANADGSYQINLQLSQSARTETQTSFASGQQCTWSGTDGVAHAVAAHNCMEPVAWFLPDVALFGSQQPQGVTPTLAGTATAGSIQEIDIRDSQTTPNATSADAIALLTHLSTVDIFYDPTAYLPTSLFYNIHPDVNAAQDIPVEIIFSNYQTVGRVTVPFRIQRYVNGSLSLDISISSVSVS